jgi:hydroxymethylbilane synthase
LSGTPLRIGTRGSTLALIQARAVADALDEPVEIVTITTAGDVQRAVGDKSRWVGALEEALLAGQIDLAVHSAKDCPGELAPGTEIVAAPRRAEPLDLLVGERRLEDVREGARVGTSALRRRAQLLAARPDLEVLEVRGNVDTRLRKREAGEVDVLVLAAAGLDRLGRRREAGGMLDHELFVPAPGQGTIAVQGRTGSAASAAAAVVSHERTMACLTAERAAVRELSATCHTPVGIQATFGTNSLRIRGFAGLPDGSEWVLDEVLAADERDGADRDAGGAGAVPGAGVIEGGPTVVGTALAQRMLAAGAGEILRRAEALAG